MWSHKHTAAFALIAVTTWACEPEDYPTSPRFEPPPEEVELPQGELFFYTPPAGLQVTGVNVPGEFNGWDPNGPNAIEMEQLPDGRWVAGIELDPGTYQYKYYIFTAAHPEGEWAGNMCNDPVYGNPTFGGKVDSALVACDPGGNGIRTIIDLPDGELFFYTPPAGVTITSVSVPGEFNGWNPGDPAAQMTELGDGRWVAGIPMAAGTYEYKYHFNHDETGAGGDWAGNMCDDATFGDPTNGNDVDPDLDSCAEGGNAIRTVESSLTGHTFLYMVPAGVDVEVVTVTGSFQDPQWQPDADTMTNIWEYTVDLAPGTYQYKYVFNTASGWAGNMCDEPTWGHPDFGNAADPDNDNCVSGGQDAEITITEAGPHTFRYIVPAGVDSIGSISVAGSFQQPTAWQPHVDFMSETFQRRFDIAPGTYQYKFRFDGNWAGDMCNETTYGHPANDNDVDWNGEGCVEGGQDAEIVIE
jgi:hypothetical protein